MRFNTKDGYIEIGEREGFTTWAGVIANDVRSIFDGMSSADIKDCLMSPLLQAKSIIISISYDCLLCGKTTPNVACAECDSFVENLQVSNK